MEQNRSRYPLIGWPKNKWALRDESRRASARPCCCALLPKEASTGRGFFDLHLTGDELSRGAKKRRGFALARGEANWLAALSRFVDTTAPAAIGRSLRDCLEALSAYCAEPGFCAAVPCPLSALKIVTSTRRFFCRSSRVFSSLTGLSLPSPTIWMRYTGILCCATR